MNATKDNFSETPFHPRLKNNVIKIVIFIYNYFSSDRDCQSTLPLTAIFLRGSGVNSTENGDSGYPLNIGTLRLMTMGV